MIYIVIVNWNGVQDTIECLEALLRLEGPDFRVLVIDNASTDGTVDRLRAWAAGKAPFQPAGEVWSRLPAQRRRPPEFAVLGRPADFDPRTAALITLVPAGGNVGFAMANNIALRLALEDARTRYVWLLNNDTAAEPSSLSALVSCMEARPQVGILGSMLLFHDDPDRVQGVAARFNFWTAHGSHLGQGLLRSEVGPAAAWERRMAYVMGASMFVRREVVEAVGPMAEDYFLYFEELDWARRIRGRFSQGICFDAVVWHKEGGSIGSASRSTPSDTSTYYLSVNLLRFYAKHLPALMPLAVARLFYEAFKFIRGGDWHSPRVVMAGLGDYILGRRRRGPVRIGRRVERAS